MLIVIALDKKCTKKLKKTFIILNAQLIEIVILLINRRRTMINF